VTTIFERLSREPAFQELFRHARHRDIARNCVVIAEGARPEHLYLIVSGLVSVRHTRNGGEELLLAYMYPGDFFGEMGLFPGVHARSAMIRSASDCALLEIPYKVFIELTQRHPALWLELAGQLASRLRNTNRRLAEMPTLHAADRVWLVLREMADSSGSPGKDGQICLRITRSDLGKLAGCSRELTGMILRDLAAEGRIQLEGRSLLIRPGGLVAEVVGTDSAALSR
jgi:CRP/FNR family cyclic AMP-dependent transcriptional regulator